MSPKAMMEHFEAAQRLLSLSPVGVFSDVDGTISEVAPTPDGATVTPLCREGLKRLVGRVALVAAISGRSALYLHQMVRVDGMVYVGNHGMELWREGAAEIIEAARKYRPALDRALEELQPYLGETGLMVEDKQATVAFHFRGAPDPEATERRLLAAIQGCPSAQSLKLARGKRILELMPPVERDKGKAVEDLVQEYGLRSAIYVGDDITDVHAMRCIRELRASRPDFNGLAIGVLGGKETPSELEEASDFALASVDETCRFYGRLADSAEASRP